MVESETGVKATKICFPGQYLDDLTDLNYNYFRDYDPITGRYIQSDPIGLLGGLNTYSYVFQNPVGYFDPLGLEIFVCNRKVSGFPYIGNHAYAWDSSTNTSDSMRGSSRKGLDGSGEKGPSGDSCNVVEGSKGKEKEIMDFLAKNKNNGVWIPMLNDCHNAVKDAVKNSDVSYPGAPGGRFGKPH